MDAHTHLIRAKPETLTGEGEDRLYAMEEKAIGEIASVKEDKHPRAELQEPGVSHLPIQEKARSFTSGLPSPITPEAARMQRSPAVNTEIPATPEPDRSADLEPLPEAVEPPDRHPPEQIRAPHRSRRAVGVAPGRGIAARDGPDSPASARAPEGETPIEEAHGRPPDLPDLKTQGPIVCEPESDDLKAHVRATQARRPVPDEGSRVRPNPWLSPGIIIINRDTYFAGQHHCSRGRKTYS